jgi:hypothetical protein
MLIFMPYFLPVSSNLFAKSVHIVKVLYCKKPSSHNVLLIPVKDLLAILSAVSRPEYYYSSLHAIIATGVFMLIPLVDSPPPTAAVIC